MFSVFYIPLCESVQSEQHASIAVSIMAERLLECVLRHTATSGPSEDGQRRTHT